MGIMRIFGAEMCFMPKFYDNSRFQKRNAAKKKTLPIYERDIPLCRNVPFVRILFFEIEFLRNAFAVFDLDSHGILHLVFERFDIQMMHLLVR